MDQATIEKIKKLLQAKTLYTIGGILLALGMVVQYWLAGGFIKCFISDNPVQCSQLERMAQK